MNVLVTGASRGLGLETTKQLLHSGNQVFALSRSLTEELIQLRNMFGDQLQFIQYDLTDIDAIKNKVFKAVFGLEVPIHGLICNAAIAYDDLISNSNQSEITNMFTVNVFAAMELTKQCIRNMLLHRTVGSIVYVSSICARKGYKGLSMYAATKGAIESFSRGVAREWGSKGIRANCVVPGFLETDMSAKLDDQQRSKVFGRNSLGKPATIHSVASAICFLISPNSESITGQEIVVDAGTI